MLQRTSHPKTATTDAENGDQKIGETVKGGSSAVRQVREPATKK